MPNDFLDGEYLPIGDFNTSLVLCLASLSELPIAALNRAEKNLICYGK